MEQPPSNSENTPSQQAPVPPKRNRFFEKEYIDTLKEDVVKDILSTILRKSGNEEALKQFVPFKDITSFQNANGKTSGSYYAENHTIELNRYHLQQTGENYSEENEKGATKAITLATILHEELHAITNKNFIIEEGDFEGTRQSGFQTETIDAVTRESLGKTWVRFNEGITELIKDDVLEEYIRRTGDRKEFLIKGYEDGLESSTYQTYTEERAMVNGIFMRVSALTGVSLDVVREGFVQAYFSGALAEDIKETLREMGGDILLSKMEDVDRSVLKEKLKDGMEKYALTNATKPEEVKGFVEEYFIAMCTNYMKRSIVS